MGYPWRGLKGYTIVEVMIVLGITGVIFASSVAIFGNRRGDTEFSQAMQDLQSEFQTLSTQVTTSNLPLASEGYYCSITASSPPSPYLSTNSSIANQNECIYLGRAVQIIPNSADMYIYPILGLKDINGDPANGQPSTALQANPTPAVGSTGSAILYDSYSLINGTKFKAVASPTHAAHMKGVNTEADFLAVYSSLQSGNSSGSDTSAFTAKYTAATAGTPPDFANLTKCVRQASPCNTITDLGATNAWSLCVQDSSGQHEAGLVIQASAAGLTTSLNMDTCP